MQHSELKSFYDNLSKINADTFRKEVLERCEWTYAIWQTKIRPITGITNLEAEAIELIMEAYKPVKA